MNKKQKSLTNKGFSLVELIIVIAIMAVLVGVLAPQFLKYVEQSRRSKDIQTANNLQTAYLADIADSLKTGTATKTEIKATADLPSTVSEVPETAGTFTGTADHFYVSYNATNGTCQIFAKVGSDFYELTTTGTSTEKGNATAYKDLK